MKKVFAILALLFSVLVISYDAKAQSNEKAAVEKLIFSYRDIL